MKNDREPVMRACNEGVCWVKLYQELIEKDDQEAKYKWYCAKCNPATDKGKFLLSLGRSKGND